MVETVGTAVRAMVEQTDSQYEVLVVDGGSSDGSQGVLRGLEDKHDRVRVILDRSGECDWLGGDRNISFEEARGEFVLESLDADNLYYYGIIKDFVRIFNSIKTHRHSSFYLSGPSINIAPRSLLLDVPYRDLGGAEDRDLWRRLFARDALIWLDAGPVGHALGYDFGLRGEITRDLHGKETELRTGVTLASCLRYALTPGHPHVLERERPLPIEVVKRGYDLVTWPYAALRARGKESWPAPAGFERKGALEQAIVDQRMTLPELEAEYGFYLDRDEFSAAGRRAFVEYAHG